MVLDLTQRKFLVLEHTLLQIPFFRIGDSVFLKTTMPRKVKDYNIFKDEGKDFRRDLYPEYHRYGNIEQRPVFLASAPFSIGIIDKIYKKEGFRNEDYYVYVRKMYRPHEMKLDEETELRKDLNIVYWSGEFTSRKFSDIIGKCTVRSTKSIKDTKQSVDDWAMDGEYRFYFNEVFENESNVPIKDLPVRAEKYRANEMNEGALPKVKPLKCLDLFW